MDIPRIFNITESAHRIHDPFTPEKLATLGAALRLERGTRVLDLGSGSGEMLCTWARDYGVIGTGIDMSQLFTEQAKLRAEELGVAHQVKFIHGDAAGYVSDEKVDVAACVGATWIAGGVAGTIELLARSLRTGGIILIGEPYWRQLPPTEDIAKGCLAHSISDFLMLPELLASFGHIGYDVVEMVLADQDGWDRYEAAKWLTMRRWLEANPGDELAKEVRAKLTSEPERYAAYTREYLGWGVFEFPAFAEGTFAIAHAVADSGATSIIGGGESVAAIQQSGLASKITHISTGGGASLEMLEGIELPGLAALQDK